MSYFPIPSTITTTESLSLKSLDGVETYVIVQDDAAIPSGTTDTTSFITSISRFVALYGGVDRDTGQFHSMPGFDRAAGYTSGIEGEILSGGTTFRIDIGTYWTGAATRILTNGTFILEYTQ